MADMEPPGGPRGADRAARLLSRTAKEPNKTPKLSAAQEPAPALDLARHLLAERRRIGLRLANLPVFRSGTNGPWVGAPAVPRLDQEKRQRRDDAGKPLFDAAFTWWDRATADLFSKAVLRLLLQKHPNALDHGDGQRELLQ